MKIAIISDTHAGCRNDSPAFNEYFIRFYEEVFFPYLKENNIKTVIHLGDVYDRRKYINLNTLHAWQTRVFKQLYELTDRVDIIIGNHDSYFKDSNKVNSVDQTLSLYKDKFNVYQNSKEIEIENLKILYVPWICEDNVVSTIELINNTDAKVCMGHLELIGFDMFPGHTNLDKGLQPSIFDKFFLTLSGHFHHKSSKGGIHYVGSPYPFIWSDWGDRRGFHIFDTESLELEFIENPYQIFQKIYYNDANETFESLLQKDYSFIKGMFVKVIVQKKTNQEWFEQFLEVLHQQNPQNVSVIEASLDDPDFEDEDGLEQTKDTLTLLKEYVEKLEVNLDKEQVLNLIVELYMESLNQTERIQGEG